MREWFSRFYFLLKRPILSNLSEWLLLSNLAWFAFMLKSHCIAIISISNDIMRIYWTLARVKLSLLPYLWQKQFHCTIKVCGGPAKLSLWKISSIHYIWCFPFKISFVNGDKSAGSPQNLQKESPHSMQKVKNEKQPLKMHTKK